MVIYSILDLNLLFNDRNEMKHRMTSLDTKQAERKNISTTDQRVRTMEGRIVRTPYELFSKTSKYETD